MPPSKEASCPGAQDTCLTVHSQAYFPGFLGRDGPESQKQEDNRRYGPSRVPHGNGHGSSGENSDLQREGEGGSHLLDGQPSSSKTLCCLARRDLRRVCPRRRSRRRPVKLRRIYPRSPIRLCCFDRRSTIPSTDNAPSFAFIEAG